MKRSLLPCSALMGLMLAGNTPLPGDEVFASRVPVSDVELAEQRGGFTYSGMDIKLGAEIRTYLDGELALRTTVSWGDQGTSHTEVLSAALTPADAAQLQQGILSSGGITMRVGGSQVFLANQGQTALIHRTDGGLQNVLINTANDVNIMQEVDASLDLGGYDGFSAGLTAERLGNAVGDVIAGATVGALNN
jgi:hypothetical protein